MICIFFQFFFNFFFNSVCILDDKPHFAKEALK